MMVKVIFITGGSASGKTTLAHQLKNAFGDRALLISQDMFYKPTQSASVNYDVPSAFDFPLQSKVLRRLFEDKETVLPIYDFNRNDRTGTVKVAPAEIIIFEGLFTFYDVDLLAKADLKIFVDTPSDTRLGRRIIRDVTERGRDIREVVARWINDVQPSYRTYISNLKHQADMVIPWTVINHRATGFLVSTISQLTKKGNIMYNFEIDN